MKRNSLLISDVVQIAHAASDSDQGGEQPAARLPASRLQHAALRQPAAEKPPAPAISALELAEARAGNAEPLLRVLQQAFGHAQFRSRQLEVILRILNGTSTLAILPTGESPHVRRATAVETDKIWLTGINVQLFFALD